MVLLTEPSALIPDILALTCAALETGLGERPRERRKPAKDAYAGPLWTKVVPGAKKIVPFVMDFIARDGLLEFKLNDRPVASGRFVKAVAETDGLRIHYQKSFFSGETTEERALLEYPEQYPQSRPLCSGDWTRFGIAEVRFNSRMLIPTVTRRGNAGVIAWPDPPVARYTRHGLFGLQRITTTSIKEIVVTEQGAQIVATGLSHYAIPDLTWGD